MCCGSGGFYSLVEPDVAGQILDAKMENVAATGADIVVTANPGCMVQLELGLARAGIPGSVCHVVDILDEAYQAEVS